MGIPSASELKSSILEFLKDKKTHTIEETRTYIVKRHKISESDKNEISERRKRPIFNTRIVQALSDLRRQGIIENEEKGKFKMK
jgi:restriction endonuclease Mrr